jgi:hypothetical protein
MSFLFKERGLVSTKPPSLKDGVLFDISYNAFSLRLSRSCVSSHRREKATASLVWSTGFCLYNPGYGLVQHVLDGD